MGIDLFDANPDAWISPSSDDTMDVIPILDRLGVADARGLLDLLARRRVIDWESKRILEWTLIEGRTMKEVSRPEEYERRKHQRNRALQAIREYLARLLRDREDQS